MSQGPWTSLKDLADQVPDGALLALAANGADTEKS